MIRGTVIGGGTTKATWGFPVTGLRLRSTARAASSISWMMPVVTSYLSCPESLGRRGVEWGEKEEGAVEFGRYRPDKAFLRGFFCFQPSLRSACAL